MKEGKRKENIDDHGGEQQQREVDLRMQAAELRDMHRKVLQLDLHPEGKISFHELEAEIESFIASAQTDAVRIIPGLGVQGKLKGMVKPWIEKNPLVEKIKDEGGSFFVLLRE
ncbi:Smr/MutS family protein [Candidatus Gottesmanbacteria bacterium]|nr:Smr/MutS family protein [Candidatus Gottesmanbacteria bacterium]